MSNTEKVERLLARIAMWRSELFDNHGAGATAEEVDVALDILRVGGERALIIGGRVMAQEMTAADWVAVRDAHAAIAEGADRFCTPSIEVRGDANS